MNYSYDVGSTHESHLWAWLVLFFYSVRQFIQVYASIDACRKWKTVSYISGLVASLVSKPDSVQPSPFTSSRGVSINQRTRQLVTSRVRASLCPDSLAVLFSFSPQMLIATGHRKVQTDTLKAYRKHTRKQNNYHQCQLGHVTPENALLISVCILILPMVQLTAEHVQLATKYVHRHHMNISHTPLVLPSLGNVLSAIVLQNSVVSLNIGFPSYTSSHFSIRHSPPSLHLNLLTGLGRGVVLTLLLLQSGDIETNPGPVGELFVLAWCKAVTRWYDYDMIPNDTDPSQIQGTVLLSSDLALQGPSLSFVSLFPASC